MFTLYLGDTRIQHQLHIAKNISHPLILGWDFFTQHQAWISPTTATLEMSGTSIPLVDPSSIFSLRCNAVLVDEVTIPPMSEMNTQARLYPKHGITPDGYEGLFEPQIRDHLAASAARSLCSVRHGHITVCLINPSDDSVVLPADTHLGEFHSVTGNHQEEYQILDNVIASVDNKSSHRVNDLFPPSGLTSQQFQKAEQLLSTYSDVFSTSNDDIGHTHLAHHRIVTTTDTPIRQRAYRTSPTTKAEIQRQVDDLLERNIIEESHSPWSSPIVLVRKKDNTFRFCVDYRKLNAVTKRDSHPIPRQDDTLDALSSSSLFSVMDLSSGYWQVPLHPDDKEKTAFTTGTSLYHFNVMPFDLVNAPMTFQRLMEAALRGLHWTKCLIYLDDCIVIGRNFEEHLQNFSEVLDRFRTSGLKLKPSKCQFFRTEVTYLGHCINADGLKPDPTNVAKVMEWPTPKCVRDVRSFLGLASYYRRFIPHFSQVASPLNQLTQKNTPFVWSDSCEEAFKLLKSSLISPPLLSYPNFDEEFLVATDASNDAVGAVLSQVQGGKEKVIAYQSSTLTPTQRKWSTYDRELWAIVSAVRHFRHYLRSRHFTVLTDHKPLLSYGKIPIQDDSTGRRARWMVELHSYSFSIVHRKGRSHKNADAMSRHPSSIDSNQHPPSVPEHLCTLNVSERSFTSTGTQTTLQDDSAVDSSHTASIWSDDLLSKIRHHQRLDDDICAVKRMISTGTKFSPTEIRRQPLRRRRFLWQLNRFTIQDDTLYRTKKDEKKSTVYLQTVIPQSLVPEILRLLHSHPTSGHFSAEKNTFQSRDYHVLAIHAIQHHRPLRNLSRM